MQSQATFTYPRWKLLLTAFQQLFLAFLASLAFLFEIEDFGNLSALWIAGLIFLLWLGWIVFGLIQCTGSITMDYMGIHYRGNFGIETSLFWQEVLVRSDWSHYSLILHSAQNDKVIKLNPELDEYCTAIELVRQHRPDLWYVKDSEFHYTPPPALFARLSLPARLTAGQFLVLFFMPLLISELFFRAYQQVWYILGLIGLVVLGYILQNLFSPRKFSFHGSELVLHY